MEGAVEIESEPGKGTVVSILLPRVEGEPDAPVEAVEPRESAGGTEAVLLVEDDAWVRSSAQRVLQSHGYRVLVAGNGLEALDICRSEKGPIDLLLTDIVMPGLGGRELARRVVDLRPDLRGVIFTSGYDAAEATPEPLANAHSFLPKPYRPRGLLAEVRRLLDTGAHVA